MLLVLYYLVVVHVLPSDSQFDGCLRKQFNCIAAKFRGEYTPLGFHLTDSTEKVFYDEDRRMIAREEYAHTDGQPFLTFRLYDYPNETLYDVVTVDGKETCVKLALDEPFRKVCMPKNTQLIWGKSPLGSLPNMVPTNRYKWEVGNLTIELTYTYMMQPVLLDTYGTDQDGASVFETVWIQNITDTPVSSAFFTPPPSCMDAVLQNTLEPYRRNWGYLAF
ncbi:uncharacterized protein LOC124111497 isoform X1 [Haliotis rufescens]|uniref:uncharacterized protein LOC124111497 isoform X1 n=1 Tax=Haliotis rufescens TaxID=6454 RepID=UPI00201EF4DA|nr:uncharacterized protein LOC124111497 isoform X1 [Haliotis rufescens]